MPERARSRSLPTIALVVMGALVVMSLTVSAVLLLRPQEVVDRTDPAPPGADRRRDGGRDARRFGRTSRSAAVVRRPDTPGSASASNAEPKAPATATSATDPGAAAHRGASAKTTAAATTSSPSSGAPARAPPRRRRAGGRVNCDPPYVVDKNGHQHFIPECMK